MTRNGDVEGGKQRVRLALCCNIVAIVGAILGFIAVGAGVIEAAIKYHWLVVY